MSLPWNILEMALHHIHVCDGGGVGVGWVSVTWLASYICGWIGVVCGTNIHDLFVGVTSLAGC